LVLTDKERRQVDKIKYKIFNYIDRKDIVTIGYPEKGSEGAVGTVVNINSKDRKNIGTQHMWGGYEYDSGHLNVRESDLQDYRLARAKQAMEQLDIKKKGSPLVKPVKVYLRAGQKVSFSDLTSTKRKDQAKEMEEMAMERVYELRDAMLKEHPGRN